MSKPILCLDFDGVLHSYTSGWQGADVIADPPVEGAIEFMFKALDRFDVQVFSSRSNQEGGIKAMREWLNREAGSWLFRVRPGLKGDDPIYQHSALELCESFMMQITFPTEKPPAMVTIDDRAITFTGQWPDIDSLLAFKPWNKS